MVPVVPVGFAFATEVTHPVSPALVIGLMCCFGSVTCFVMTEIFVAILSGQNEKDTRLVFIIMAIMALGATFFSFFIREDLRRLSSVSSISMMSAQNNTLKVSADTSN